MYRYMYRLGHCPELGVAEYSQTYSDFEVQGGWLLSNDALDVDMAGSLVYRVCIIDTLDSRDGHDVYQSLYDYLHANSADLKKIGTAVPHRFSRDILKLAKEAGCKKVNVLKDQLPNFGHWKGLKNWVLVFEHGEKIIIGRIESYSNQEFWSYLDSHLPVADMRRGMINLKLARSMLNLTDNQYIFDPFCGVGRVAVAGLDRSCFFLSDRDETCLDDCEKNTNYAKVFWKSESEVQIQAHDAREITHIHEDLSKYTVVTEGYLGTNFSTKPHQEQIQKELENQKYMWVAVLKECKQKGIREVIACLPFYRVERGVKFTSVQEIGQEAGYMVEKLANRDGVLYARKDSLVGHYVVKWVLKK
jgi:hypothetical protein